MSRFRTIQAVLLSCLVSVAAVGTLAADDFEEGSYPSIDGVKGAFNFIKHFDREQYKWSYKSKWMTYNNMYLDGMDFSYYCGHGIRYIIQQKDGAILDLRTAGGTSSLGLGDRDLEFLVIHACQTVPSPLEVMDWWSAWVGPKGIFDGLHQTLGYRTNYYLDTAASVASLFGYQMKRGGAVWQSWFNVLDRFSDPQHHGCAVMHPSCELDTYRTWAADPPRDHRNLRVWWQY